MNPLHGIIELDQWFFTLINVGLSNPLFDALLLWFREKWFWMPLYLFIGAYASLNYGKRGWLIILGLILVAGLSDFTSSTLIKKRVIRIRPCNDIEMVDRMQERVGCGGGYSFPSSHASNHFAAAVFLIGVFRLKGKWPQKALLAWAGLIAFSQVYVGVHYPLDVICGAILGSLIASLVLYAWRKWVN